MYWVAGIVSLVLGTKLGRLAGVFVVLGVRRSALASRYLAIKENGRGAPLGFQPSSATDYAENHLTSKRPKA